MKPQISVVPFLALALVALCEPAFAQTDAITATASRTVDLLPDQISFSLAILTDSDVALDQVLQASQTLGLATRDLTGINSQQFGPSPNQTRLAYTFEFDAPFAKFRETNDKMTALRRTLAANTPSMELQLYAIAVSPSDASTDQARQGVLAQLFADARLRADQLAKTAGVTLGKVLGVSEASGIVPGPYGYGSYGPTGPGTLRSTFSLSVRYAIQ